MTHITCRLNTVPGFASYLRHKGVFQTPPELFARTRTRQQRDYGKAHNTQLIQKVVYLSVVKHIHSFSHILHAPLFCISTSFPLHIMTSIQQPLLGAEVDPASPLDDFTPMFYIGHHESKRPLPVTDFVLRQAQDVGVRRSQYIRI